jgi:hypothetical protein
MIVAAPAALAGLSKHQPEPKKHKAPDEYDLVIGFRKWLTAHAGEVRPFYTAEVEVKFGCFEDFALEVYLETCL